MNYLADNYRLRMITLAAMLVFTAASFLLATLNTIPFWDMLGYAASVLSLSENDPSAIHTAAYTDLRNYVSPATYQELANGSEYRSIMSSDPNAFHQQIPYYKIRFLYVLILLTLSTLGLGIYTAIHLVSAVLSSAALLMIYFGLRCYIHSFFWLITPFVYYGVTSKFKVIQAGGVDAFAFFWVALTFVAFIRGSRFLIPLVALSVLVRTDLIIHVALILGMLLLLDKSQCRKIVFWGVVSLGLYVFVNIWAGNYGWKTLIYFVFVSDMSATHPDVYSTLSFSVYEYLEFVLNSRYWISPWFWVTTTCGLASLLLCLYGIKSSAGNRSKSYRAMCRFNIVAAVSLAYIVLHYLLFPALFMRFFIGQYMFLILALLATVTYSQSEFSKGTFVEDHSHAVQDRSV